MNLSPQAQWYLRGPFPVVASGVYGHRKPEPTAMASLVAAGLCEERDDVTGRSWVLTAAGRAARGECCDCGKRSGHWGWCTERDACPVTLRTGEVAS